MKIEQPKQFMNPDFKFFLVVRNRKIPQEIAWNSTNNYEFFDPKLINHLKSGGNYGAVCGLGSLIVLDFDDRAYYNLIKDKLPNTFTVMTANKRLFHLYYYLEGDMIRKIGIDIDKERVLDIQGDRCGIVGPGSCIDRKYYEVFEDVPIANITYGILKKAFKLKDYQFKRNKEWDGDDKSDVAEVIKTMEELKKAKVKRTGRNQYQCPHHPSQGCKNLTILPNGSLWCFHCLKHWHTVKDLMGKLK